MTRERDVKSFCLGPARDPTRRVRSRVRDQKHTASCWVGTKETARALFGSTRRGPRDMRPGA